MRKLGQDLTRVIGQMGDDRDKSRLMARTLQVRDRYRAAIATVYRDKADLFLNHTNNVYILDKDGARTLIVYVDESIFAAELNAQRELIKLVLLEQAGEQLDAFEIHISRGSYRAHHPFVQQDDRPTSAETARPASKPLDAFQQSQIKETVEGVQDERLRAALQRAMTADLQQKNAETEKNR